MPRLDDVCHVKQMALTQPDTFLQGKVIMCSLETLDLVFMWPMMLKLLIHLAAQQWKVKFFILTINFS